LGKTNKIRGGYYIKARKIMESEIAHASPVTREVFDHLIHQANFADSKKFKRGQWFGTFDHIAEGLHWYEGFRKTKYSTKQIRSAIDFLKDKNVIATKKSFRGLVITINKYNEYQDPKNYSNMGVPTVYATEGTMEVMPEVTTEGSHLSSVNEPMAVTTEGTMEGTTEGTFRAESGQTTLKEDNKNTIKKETINKKEIVNLMKKLDVIFFNHHVQLGVYSHLVEKAVIGIGGQSRVAKTIDFYLDKVGKGSVEKKYIYKHPKNFWTEGIFAIHNEMYQKETVVAKAETVTKYCIECHQSTEFKKGEALNTCPKCGEGDLFNKRMYNHERSVRGQLPEPEEQTEEQVWESKKLIDSLVESFQTPK